jgi:hypothetical protein
LQTAKIYGSGHGRPYGNVTVIGRESFGLAMLRIVRDRGGGATDYHTFVEKLGEAAASWQIYRTHTTKDLYNEMDKRNSDGAKETVSIIFKKRYVCQKASFRNQFRKIDLAP